MMAKMFYTLDETKAALGKNEEEIKQYAREGRLREFRDGPRLMFKADQVEAIKSELGLGGDAPSGPDIGISDTGAPLGMADSRSSSASGISLSDTEPSARSSTGSGISLAGSGTGTGMSMKDDTALAADLGLSGSVGGVPSPGRPGGSLSGTGVGGRSGVNIFSPEEGEAADPMAQTNIASNVPDQVSLEAVGSGSGLLDLTRESDDTSLGAELLDEIAPGTGSRAGSRGGTRAGSGTSIGGSRAGTAVGEPAITPGRTGGRAVVMPLYVEQADAVSAALGGAALGAALFLLLGGLALTGAVMRTKVPLLEFANGKSIWMIFGAGFGVSFIFFLAGLVMGRR